MQCNTVNLRLADVTNHRSISGNQSSQTEADIKTGKESVNSFCLSVPHPLPLWRSETIFKYITIIQSSAGVKGTFLFLIISAHTLVIHYLDLIINALELLNYSFKLLESSTHIKFEVIAAVETAVPGCCGSGQSSASVSAQSS